MWDVAKYVIIGACFVASFVVFIVLPIVDSLRKEGKK